MLLFWEESKRRADGNWLLKLGEYICKWLSYITEFSWLSPKLKASLAIELPGAVVRLFSRISKRDDEMTRPSFLSHTPPLTREPLFDPKLGLSISYGC
jgi:hypothetical protein